MVFCQPHLNFEVIKYLTVFRMPGPIYGGVMNLKRWEGLSADVKEMLMNVGKDTQELARKEVQKMDKESIENLKTKGMDIHFLPKRRGGDGKRPVSRRFKGWLWSGWESGAKN